VPIQANLVLLYCLLDRVSDAAYIELVFGRVHLVALSLYEL